MDCDACRELQSALLDNEATDIEQLAVDGHLATCDACRSYERDLATLHRRTRLHAGEPVPDQTSRIMHALPRTKPRRWIAAAAAAVAAAVAGVVFAPRADGPGSSAAPRVEVSHVALSRAPTGGISVVSFRLHNLSANEDALVGVVTDAAGDASLHTVRTVDGRTIMRAVDEIVVAGGETRDLGDGTSHIMLLDLRERLDPGGSVHIELQFARAAPIDLDAMVTA